jgi:hypothetical protein
MLGLATSAQPISANGVRDIEFQLGSASESDSANSVQIVDSVNVGAANESDSAQASAPVVPITVNIGEANETDSAGSATPQSEQLVDTGTASETDTAQGASVALSLSSPIGTFEPGNTVQITINKVIDSLTCSAGAVTLTTNNGSIIEFLAPEPPLFGDKTLTYNTAITFTATAGSETAEFNLPIQPRTSELFGEITNIDSAGIYADDTLNVGNFSHVKNITGDVILDVSDGTHSNVAASSLEYALYDGVWSDYGTESFPAQDLIVNAGGASETDTAQPATPSTPGLVNVGEASEADSAGSATPGVGSGVEVATGTASETDSVPTATPETPQSVGVGVASETDSAGGSTATAAGTVQVGTAGETDTAPALESVGSDQDIQTGSASEADSAGSTSPLIQNLDFIEPANTVLVEVAPMATVKHDGVNIPDWPAKDPDADIWNGLTLDFLADDDPVTGYSILINDQPANHGDTIDGLTLIDSDSDLAKTITARLGAGTFGERYKVTTRYSTASIPSDDKSAYLRIINQ